MELLRYTLPNGIRLIHCPVQSPVAHCGIFIHAGSRDETEKEHGLAHFIEHNIFKGTQKRSVFQVLNRLENVGADLNAYTTKEETCIYATFLLEDYDRAMDLFQDIFFQAKFPEKEIGKEKQVVIDEIRSYQDTPAEQINDDFEDLLFKGHSLGRNILGTIPGVKRFTRKGILDFIYRNYQLEEVVIASVGAIPFKRLVRMADKYFSSVPERGTRHSRQPVKEYQPFTLYRKKHHAQVHCVIGSPAFSYPDPRRIPLALLNNILGGPVMNSRLSLALRERNGLTYHNESNYIPYSDAGIMTIYFGTDQVHYDKALTIVHKELEKLRTSRLSTSQMHIIRKQFAGQLMIARESNLALMMALGKSLLLQDTFEPPEIILEQIHKTTADQLLSIAAEIFQEKGLSMLTFGG